MREVLATLPTPYSEDVIDEVFFAIEKDPRWRRDYDGLCDNLGKTVVNTWGGFWIANAIGKVGERQVPSRKSTLIGSYSILDTDAKTIVRTPNDGEARQLMADYYRAHKDELSPEVRTHREQIVELIMNGVEPAEAFAIVVKLAPPDHSESTA